MSPPAGSGCFAAALADWAAGGTAGIRGGCGCSAAAGAAALAVAAAAARAVWPESAWLSWEFRTAGEPARSEPVGSVAGSRRGCFGAGGAAAVAAPLLTPPVPSSADDGAARRPAALLVGRGGMTSQPHEKAFNSRPK